MSALSSVLTFVLLVTAVLLRLIVFCFFTILLFGIRQTDNLFIQFASKKPILS